MGWIINNFSLFSKNQIFKKIHSFLDSLYYKLLSIIKNQPNNKKIHPSGILKWGGFIKKFYLVFEKSAVLSKKPSPFKEMD